MIPKNYILCALLWMALAFGVEPVQAQVAEIKQEAQRDKDNRRARGAGIERSTSGAGDYFSSDDDMGFGETIAMFLLKVTVLGVYYVGEQAQLSALEKRETYPERVSLEGSVNAAVDATGGTMGFQPKLRANWGIFATDFRYSRIEDYSGSLNAIDWQVLTLRVPIKKLNLEYGIGFTSLLDPGITYFESSAGADWRMRQKLTVNAVYRWTAKNNYGERFRQEASVACDFQTWQWGKLRVAPMLGYTYQKYFDVDQIHFVKFGLVGRFF